MEEQQVKITVEQEIEQTRRIAQACYHAGFNACRDALQQKKVTNAATEWSQSEIRQALEEVFCSYRDEVADDSAQGPNEE